MFCPSMPKIHYVGLPALCGGFCIILTSSCYCARRSCFGPITASQHGTTSPNSDVFVNVIPAYQTVYAYGCIYAYVDT